MKKTTKKLALAKETLRGLGAMTLSKVAGGSVSGSNINACSFDNSCQMYCLDEPLH